MGTVSLEELKVHIIATYQPTDDVCKRILAYIALMQKGMATKNYVRLRQQTLNALHSDGLIIPADLERALFVSSLQGRLQAEITRKPDWWTKPNHQLLEEAVAVSKALEGGRNSAGGRSLNYLGQKRPAHHLQVAAGRPRTGEERDGSSTRERQQAVDEKTSADRPPRPTLAAATARRSKDTGRERGSESSRQFTPSMKDMKQNYTDAEWRERAPNWDAPGTSYDKIQGGPSPADAPQLFRKDRHPDSGKPYCLRCRTTGHTLDTCTRGTRSSSRDNSYREERGGFRRNSGQSQKRRRQ